MMDSHTITELGGFAEQTLCDPRFHAICDKFNEMTIAGMLATKPDEVKKREQIYATYNGYNEFLAFLQQLNIESRKLQEPPVDHLDDPDVHDIYK